MMRVEVANFKIEQYRDTMATVVTASSLAKKIKGSLTVGADRAYSNGRS